MLVADSVLDFSAVQGTGGWSCGHFNHSALGAYTGFQSYFMIDLDVGTVIDFAIDPTGILVPGRGDGIESARAHGTHFSASIATVEVPEPAALALVLVGLCGVCAARRSRQR